jgi:hypothetical protein
MSQQRNRSLSHGSASHKGSSNNNGNAATNNSNSNNVPSNTHTSSNSGASTPAKKVNYSYKVLYVCQSSKNMLVLRMFNNALAYNNDLCTTQLLLYSLARTLRADINDQTKTDFDHEHCHCIFSS